MASFDKKPKMTKEEKLSILDSLIHGINEKSKKKVIGRLGSDEEILDKLTVRFIPTPSLQLNDVMGGGFPRRRTTILAGLPDSGKTSLALETISKAMKEDETFVAAWIESENSLQKEYLCETFNIDPDRFVYVEHSRITAGEKALDIAEALLASGTIDLFCINSLKCLVPSEEFEKTLDKAVVGVQARMNARMTRKFTSLVAENDTAFIIVTHLSTDINKTGPMCKDPLVITGGNAIIYAASIILDLRKKFITKDDPVFEEYGDKAIKIHVKVKKNHCVPDKNPYLQTDYYAIFGEGIEQSISAVEDCIAKGILHQSGSFIKELDSNGEVRIIKSDKSKEEGIKLIWQGKKNLLKYIKENPEYLNYLYSKTDDSLIQQIPEEEIKDIIDDEKKIAESINEKIIKNKSTKTKKSKNKE